LEIIMLRTLDNQHLPTLRTLVTPALLKGTLPLSASAKEFIALNRREASRIIKQRHDRLLVIVGPCSIHDPVAAVEYGQYLAHQIKKHRDTLLIFMRTYFEKPRTTIGWKGFISDPGLDNSYRINDGLYAARKLLLDLTMRHVPCATEFLSTITSHYLTDLISWCAIGSRTTESQIHRELASGLPMPVGFKNGTDGNIQIALDAICSASQSHTFVDVDNTGLLAIARTVGNDLGHVILRGSHQGPNYDKNNINDTSQILAKRHLVPALMVDCSHGNSLKDYTRQAIALHDIAKQIADGSQQIMGVMIESNLVAGRQYVKKGESLVYGQSITDACIDMNETVELLNVLAHAVQKRRQ
jgi:3-deoxy-7-phosphoheptulonate synthase